jgi:hypothetical protein
MIFWGKSVQAKIIEAHIHTLPEYTLELLEMKFESFWHSRLCLSRITKVIMITETIRIRIKDSLAFGILKYSFVFTRNGIGIGSRGIQNRSPK